MSSTALLKVNRFCTKTLKSFKTVWSGLPKNFSFALLIFHNLSNFWKLLFCDWNKVLSATSNKQNQQQGKLKAFQCLLLNNHYVKCPYSEDFWSIFSRIQTEYGDLLRKCPYAVQMRENTDQKNSEYGHYLRSERLQKTVKFGFFPQLASFIVVLTQPTFACSKSIQTRK